MWLALAVNRVNFGVELVVPSGRPGAVIAAAGAVVHRIAAAPGGVLLAIEMAGHIAIFKPLSQTSTSSTAGCGAGDPNNELQIADCRLAVR
jgi:hypothetical protein